MTIDDLIQKGKVQEAVLRLNELLDQKIPVHELGTFASLFRRTGQFHKSVKLLCRIVNDDRKARHLSPEVKAEYGAALGFIGATQEAGLLLKSIDPSDFPKKLLFESFNAMATWDGTEAIRSLKEYEKFPLSDYERIVCWVNLAAALSDEGKYEEANHLLGEVFHLTNESPFYLLRGNAYHLLASNQVMAGQWAEANETLAQAEKRLAGASRLESFFVHKWKAILEVMKTKGEPASLRQMESVRKEARKLEHWETLRDFDRYECVATRNKELYEKVNFGTPYPHFRERLSVLFGTKPVLPTQYVWRLGNAHAKYLDVSRIEGLREGHLLHRLLLTFMSDFYRPLRVATIFANLYQGERYNSHSSPNRIYFAVSELRDFLKTQNCGLGVAEANGSYKLVSTSGVNLLVNRELRPQSRESVLIYSLQKAVNSTSFTSNQAATSIGSPYRTVVRLLGKALDQGLISKSVNGREVNYKFTNRKA